MNQKEEVLEIAKRLLKISSSDFNWDNDEECWCITDKSFDEIIKIAKYIIQELGDK